MERKLFVNIILTFFYSFVSAQDNTVYLKDSTVVSANPKYDKVSNSHRRWFGGNYRKEWAVPTKLPVLKISDWQGGLNPKELGGGHQSKSLRLIDGAGVEWVLRTVSKSADSLAPKLIRNSVYQEWIEDNFSAQHPYSALIVPVLAKAVGVPHSNPLIVWVAPDEKLGQYASFFAGEVCLLERREPLGESHSTVKMLAHLDSINECLVDSTTFFKARLLDLLIADWGRHQDQWRWVDSGRNGREYYISVPRDRDQVFYINEGILPKRAASASTLSFLQGFSADYKDVNTFFINGSELNQRFLNQFSYERWMQLTRSFVNAIPDDVLKKAIGQLPESSRRLRQGVLFTVLKSRRDNLPKVMEQYYKFLYEIVDIRNSNQPEWIGINDAPDNALRITISRITDLGEKGSTIFDNIFKPGITSEIRLYAGDGKDVVKVNLAHCKIRLRIVGGKDLKEYNISNALKRVKVYEDSYDDKVEEGRSRMVLHVSKDSLNTARQFTNLYHGSGFSPAVSFRSDDGVLLGLTYKIEKEGFRKFPYGSLQKITVLKSLTTKTFRIKYAAEFLQISPKTDFVINATADLPSNRFNFFGRGNETFLNKTGDFRRYYRVKFNYFTLEPAFRFHLARHVNLSVGPSFQYSKIKSKDNEGRFIESASLNNDYFGSFITEDKSHGGVFIDFDFGKKRGDKLFPENGFRFDLRMHGYEGLNPYSEDFLQAMPQMAFYKSVDKKGHFVIANRTGAAFTRGKTTFYQSAYLGGHDNLLGYLKFRFAGDHVLYNNLETRITLPNFLHYTMPGRIGLIGFYDIGKVWVDGEHSNKYHQGVGGGIFIAPFNRLLVRAVLGSSDEGLFPNIMIGQRF